MKCWNDRGLTFNLHVMDEWRYVVIITRVMVASLLKYEMLLRLSSRHSAARECGNRAVTSNSRVSCNILTYSEVRLV